MPDVAALQARKADLSNTVKQHTNSIARLVKALGGEDAARKEPAVKTLTELLDEAKAELAKVDESIAREERQQAAARYMTPIVEAFGTLSVGSPTALPATINIEDIEQKLEKAQLALVNAQSVVAVYSHLQNVVKAQNIPEDAWDGLKPLHIVPGDGGVKVEIATRVGGTGKGGGTRVTGKVVRITGATAEFATLVGKTVGGKDSDFASWRDVLQQAIPADFAELERKRTENNSNYSARIVAGRKLGVKIEDVVEPAAEPAAA